MATQFPPGTVVYIRKYKQLDVLRGTVVRLTGHPEDDCVRVVRMDTGGVEPCVVLHASNQIQLAKLYAWQQDGRP